MAGSETGAYCASAGLVAGLTMSNQTTPATTGEDDRLTVSFATRCSVPFTLRQARRYISCSGWASSNAEVFGCGITGFPPTGGLREPPTLSTENGNVAAGGKGEVFGLAECPPKCTKPR